jgi:NAD(P)-dependent dehydrogenase (short-subunit alcohol dehydrogenase family)
MGPARATTFGGCECLWQRRSGGCLGCGRWSVRAQRQRELFLLGQRGRPLPHYADHEYPIKLTRIAMRSCLKANKPGVVLIVASGAGVTGFYGSPLYCATKHAVVGFTKSMAQAD